MFRSITLVGAFTGQMWGGGRGFLPIRESMLGLRGRRGGIHHLTEIVDSIITEKGGDFQDTKLSGDSYILIEHMRSTTDKQRITKRYIDVTSLPSLAEYVDADAIPDYEN